MKSATSIAFYSAKVMSWGKLIVSLVLGHSILQLIQAGTGFFLIRWLSVEEFAQYSIAFAFQSSAQMLVEFGFSGAIVALIGDRIHDKKVVGHYIKAGMLYRIRSFWIVGLGCLFFFPLMAFKHQWSIYITILLLIGILSNLYFSGNISYYNTPLKIHKKLEALYITQVKYSLLRFILLFVLHGVTALNAWIAVLTNSLLTIINGLVFKKKAAPLVDEPDEPSPLARKEMLDYIRPIIPGIIFAAFQGQIMLFIIGIFGDTESIAEVGALSRLGQLFTILNAIIGVLIVPYIARQPKAGLLFKYISIVGTGVIISGIVVSFSYLRPDVFLWLIGNKYANLNDELLLLMFSSSLSFINGVLWNMSASRKWVYNWMPMFNIPGVILIQLISAYFLNLDNTLGVLTMAVILEMFRLLMRIAVAVVGFTEKKNQVTINMIL